MKKINDIIDLFKINIIKTLKEENLDFNIDFDVTIPEDSSFGDISTNVSLKLSSYLKKPPREIAEIITKKFDRSLLYVSKIEIAGPGFINFYLDDTWIIKIGNMILRNGVDILKKDRGESYLLHLISDDLLNENNINRARAYAYALLNILRLKGNKVYLTETIKKDKLLGLGTFNHIINIFPYGHLRNLCYNTKGEIVEVGNISLQNGKNRFNENIKGLIGEKRFNFWALSKTAKRNISIPLGSAVINTTDNPYFFVSYVYERANNINSILEREGYKIGDNLEDMSFNLVEGKKLIFQILDLEKVMEEAIRFKEPYKLFNYLYNFCVNFYEYNKKLFIREFEEKNILGNMYILNVIKVFVSEILSVLTVKVFDM
ncbi:DALR anticodon-binding domain-containing protein [Caloranaerobacter ferrireducens]|uniref:DALR anticodon-binding domain-containing protein n=1 Tax=Caloranaerobacter ferrireducens TaxID=1323370 RepID=UPI00084DFD9C|nr:DALR anticodon-binding domain-containing protein [Caloranaerobacter ferrireducens]